MVEYKKEGHERFGILITKIYSIIGERLSYISKDTGEIKGKDNLQRKNIVYKHGEIESGIKDERSEMSNAVDPMGRTIKVESVSSGAQRVGRNDLCPCGSGKKYKNCHGKS